MKTRHRLLLAGLAAALLPISSYGAKLFDVVVTDGTNTVRQSSSSAEDLVTAVVNNEDAFAVFAGQVSNGALKFQGVRDAIVLNQQADGSGSVQFLSDNGTILRTGPDGRQYRYEQVTFASLSELEDYMKKNGSAVYARFLKEINRLSTLGVSDGNPSSSTASTARHDFSIFGLTPAAELDFGDGAAEKPGLGGFGLGFNSGVFEADQGGETYNGRFMELGFAWLNLGLGDHVRLVAPLNFSYLDVEGTAIYGVSQSLAVPVRILSMDKENRWNWRITPILGANARVSIDGLAGAVLWNAGVVNSIDYRVNSRLIVCLINQVTFYNSVPVTYGDYSFDSDIEQVIAKNGLRLVTPLTKRLILDGYAIHTQFLEDAAVESFVTFGTSLSLKATKSYSLTLGANYDTGDDFQSYSVGLSSAWRW